MAASSMFGCMSSGTFGQRGSRVKGRIDVIAANQFSSPTETYAVCRMTRSYVNFLEGQIGRLNRLYSETALNYR